MLQHPEEEEQVAAARALWTLAFDSDVRKKIQVQEGCLEALQKLTTSERSSVRHMVKGALWVIADDRKPSEYEYAIFVPPSQSQCEIQIDLCFYWINYINNAVQCMLALLNW